MQEKTAIKDYIEFCDGEAVLIGHGHLKAEYVARRHVNGGDSIEQVMEHYGLNRAELHAALTYFYDNQDTLDAAHETFWTEARQSATAFRADIERRMRGDSA